MLLDACKTADRKSGLHIARHLPAAENRSQTRVVGDKHRGTVVLITIARRLDYKTLRQVGAQRLLQLLKRLAHRVRRLAFISQGEEEGLLEVFLFGKKLLCLVQGVSIVPLQARADSKVSVEQIRAGN